ncbi:hypothetical protein BGZ93_003205 [Podila epicladia]|nr:hypothetical protein BGZ92_004523 [Podila epicladia]KAG0097210.1 hypothetical protein BGZ93_003205 [Podila epicladia]
MAGLDSLDINIDYEQDLDSYADFDNNDFVGKFNVVLKSRDRPVTFTPFSTLHHCSALQVLVQPRQQISPLRPLPDQVPPEASV